MQARQCHILCVDDHVDTCSMLRALLRASGYEVTTADGVEAAKRAFGGDRFDLAVLDNRFGDGTGVDLCSWMRGQSPTMPIIFYSGAAFKSDSDGGLRAGASAYVAKPEIEGLLSAVNGLLKDAECATQAA